jgi:hypothetical protein
MVKEKKKVVKSEDKPSGPGTEQMMVTTSGRGLRERKPKAQVEKPSVIPRKQKRKAKDGVSEASGQTGGQENSKKSSLQDAIDLVNTKSPSPTTMML